MRRQGFTLIEVIIASALFAMVAVIGSATLAATYKVQDQVTLVRTRQETVRSVLQLLSRQVRLETAVSVVKDGDNSRIALTEPSDDPNDPTKTKTVQYYLDGGILMQQAGSINTSTNLFTRNTYDPQAVTSDSTVIDVFKIRQTKCPASVGPSGATVSVTNSPVYIYLNVHPKDDDSQTLVSSILVTPRAYTRRVDSECHA